MYLKKRVTITLDEKIIRKIRKEQARLHKKSGGYVSFSAVLGQYLRNRLGSRKTLTFSKSWKFLILNPQYGNSVDELHNIWSSLSNFTSGIGGHESNLGSPVLTRKNTPDRCYNDYW